MGTSEDRNESQQRRQDAATQVLHVQHSPHQSGPTHAGRAYPNMQWPTDKLADADEDAAAARPDYMEVDPSQECCEEPSPMAYAGYSPDPANDHAANSQYAQHAHAPFQLPAGPVATPITRFLTKQTFGFIPKPSFPSTDSVPRSAPASPLPALPSSPGKIPSLRLPSLSPGSLPQSPTHSGLSSPQRSFSLPAGETLSQLFGSASIHSGSAPGTPTSLPPRGSTVTLPPLKRACPSPTTTLPSLPMATQMSLEDICKPFRYQRSLSCPSDAMARAVAAEAANEAMMAPRVMLQPADIPKNRLERSSSVDVTAVLAMREAHARARYGSEAQRHPESIDLHQWLDHQSDRHPLASLAESAHAMQLLEQSRSSVDSPRGVSSPNEFHGSHAANPFSILSNDESKREKKLCAFPECASNAVTRGLCISHGGGRRCQRKGCTRGAQSKGLCVAHGGGRICKAKGCSNIQRSMGLCIRHGGGKRCSVAGCQKGVVRQDLCTAHGGKRKCKVEDCNKHVKKKGLCRSHANSVLGAYASPRGSISPEHSS